jgi:hypothetical protein
MIVDILEIDLCPCNSKQLFKDCCLPKLELLSIQQLQSGQPPAMETVTNSRQQFGLLATYAMKNGDCYNSKCLIPISIGDIIFIDKDSIWCHNCGKCERYSRKKALERENLQKRIY